MNKFLGIYSEFFRKIFLEKRKIFALAKNDLKSRYAGSYLGIFWSYFMPLVSILVYWFVFEKGFRAVPPADVSAPYIVWFMTGLIPWFYFSEAWSSSTNVLVDYSYLVKQMVFEVRILPFVRAFSAFFVHIVFLVILVIVMALYGLLPNVHLLPFIYYMICLIFLSIAVSVLTSVLMPFFRDLTQVISVITTLGFWITPIAWSYKDMQLSGIVLTILKVNPMFYVVQGYRDALLAPSFTWQSLSLNLYFWLFIGIVLSIGIVAYRRLRPHLSDVI